MDEMKI